MRPNPVKRALKAGQPAVGTWLSLGSITAARFLARAGFAWITVDIEHSLVDWETATHIFASVADAGATIISSACWTMALTASSCRWSTLGRRP
jgi:4-hydroxy-2-oxoheptanedioate aldolase